MSNPPDGTKTVNGDTNVHGGRLIRIEDWEGVYRNTAREPVITVLQVVAVTVPEEGLVDDGYDPVQVIINALRSAGGDISIRELPTVKPAN